MKHILTTLTWWISHDNGDNIAHGSGSDNGEVWTARTNWETYDNKAEWTARLLELGIDIDEQEIEDEID